MANFFITGGTGFLGSRLIQSITAGPHTVYCLCRDKKSSGDGGGPVRWIVGDLLDTSSYKDILKRADYVFHLAGLIHARRKEEFIKVNVTGTETLIEACLEAGAPLKRFVHMSSIAAMGPGYDGRLLKESGPCAPAGEYGKSKLRAEQAALTYSSRLPLVILRPTYIYGRGDMRGVKFLKIICNQPPSLLVPFISDISLCHISDVVRSCLRAAQTDTPSGETFIIADPVVYSRDQVREVVKEVITELRPDGSGKEENDPASLLLEDSNPEGFAKRITRHQYWGCDVSKAETVLGFRARVSLKEGVYDTVKWYLDEGLFNPGKEKQYIPADNLTDNLGDKNM
jgi:nucleoside-diphosphate-sugar epimerase